MIIRSTLKPGQTIGVFAPSSVVEKDDIEKSTALLKARGYEVFVHPQTYSRQVQMAGTDEEKIEALYSLWERDDIHAVWAAGGGNRALRLIDQIDYARISTHSKPLIGFSDVTALLNAIYAHSGVATFHGPVFKGLHSYEEADIEHCLGVLRGEVSQISVQGAKVLRAGAAEGVMVGGCLSLFQYIAGTRDCPDLEGAVLFLEDTGDHASRFDRMFIQLSRLGVFDKVGAVILGEFHDVQDGTRAFGVSLEEMILDYTAGSDIPVLINAPFGHGQKFTTLPIGQEASLSCESKIIALKE